MTILDQKKLLLVAILFIYLNLDFLDSSTTLFCQARFTNLICSNDVLLKIRAIVGIF